MTKKKKTGLGRGLDSLIPVSSEDESEENSSLTLEDMLKAKNKEKEDKDSEISKEKKEKKEPKPKVDIKTSQSTKNIENIDIKELKATSTEITTEKPSKSELIEDEIETKSQDESSQITKEIGQSISETEKILDKEDIKTSTESTQAIDKKDQVDKVTKATETTPDTPQEFEKTPEDIKDNLTEREKQSIDEVIKIIGKNPRITLWSAKSAAVFRYLRKTEPEFSISKEASKLIDDAVQAKYPEIWVLFKDIEK
ncbi:MAG: hypothetical protein LBU74_01745 [Methanobacteriaceae archaeon]|jgi:hypothetical protein|nr:hypothetical protein [Candidatus Methanorudis spinitermitis]